MVWGAGGSGGAAEGTPGEAEGAAREGDVQKPCQDAAEVTQEAGLGGDQLDEQQLCPAHQLQAAPQDELTCCIRKLHVTAIHAA